MTIHAHPGSEALERLLELVGEALALSDAQALHATGIALDTARLSVEDALAEVRRATVTPTGGRRVVDPIRSGAVERDRG